MKINEVIIKAMLTEKATKLAGDKIYMFQVATKANKLQIKHVIEKTYAVKVSEVHITNRKGKQKRAGRKMIKRRLPTRKIALVTVREGKINLFPEA